MPTAHPNLFAALAAPFTGPHEVKQRVLPKGGQANYITARSVANRLDSILGPENWWDEYHPLENSVICRLTIRLPDGSTVTKADAGGYAGMADSGDDDKSGFSDAFKRAAAKFGVARYLYRDGVPDFVAEREPELAQAEPQQAPQQQSRPPQREYQDRPQQSYQGDGKAPRSGKALFAWVKEQEQKHDIQLLKYMNTWSKLQEWDGRMVDWDDRQVALAYAEASRKIAASSRNDDYEQALANDRAPSTPDGGASTPTPSGAPLSDEVKAELHRMRMYLQGQLIEIARITLNKPEPKKVDGKDVGFVLSKLADDLRPRGVRAIHTVGACDDLDLLGDYLTAAEGMLIRLRTTANGTERREQMEIA